jgi:hypothetical protein
VAAAVVAVAPADLAVAVVPADLVAVLRRAPLEPTCFR